MRSPRRALLHVRRTLHIAKAMLHFSFLENFHFPLGKSQIRPPPPKKPDASHQDFFNEARPTAHEACCAHEAMLRIMKNEFSPARFASCPKDASYCVSNASFFISSCPRFFLRGSCHFPPFNI
jgi:hypothetical protein